MRAGVHSMYNNMVWTTQKFSTTFEINSGKYVDTNTGTITFPAIGVSCGLGTNWAGNQCVEPSTLVI